MDVYYHLYNGFIITSISFKNQQYDLACFLLLTTPYAREEAQHSLLAIMVFFQACYMAFCGPRSSTSEGGDELSIINEHTRLTSASHKTVVHQPPPQRRGFSVGFDNYFETSQGVSLACLHVAIYYVLAVVAYSFVFEKWTVIDSVYFATVTFTTIGTWIER
jgi:hypothetical protein